MKKRFTFLIAALMLLTMITQPTRLWGQTATQTSFTATSGSVNGSSVVSYATYKGTASTSPAVNSNAIRLYQASSSSNTGGYVVIGVSDGYQIISATIRSTMGTTTGYKLTGTDPGNTTPAKNTFNVSNYSLSANTDYTVSNIETQYIVFACFGTTTSTRLYLSKISVTYTSGSTTYTVTFDDGDGTFVPNATFETTSTEIAAGEYVLPRATPPTGYTFNGWVPDGDDTPLVGNYTVSANVDFTAQYNAIGTQVYSFEGANNFYTDEDISIHPSTGSSNNVGTIYYGDGSTFVASGSARYFSAASSGYFMLGESGATLSLPTFSGYKITQVKLHSSSGCSTQVQVSIASGSNTASNSQTWSKQNEDYTYSIGSDYQTSSLSVKVGNAKKAQITSITLTCQEITPSISANDVAIAYNATSGAIIYSIENGASGATASASIVEGATIANLAITTDYITTESIPFTCGANNSATARTASVTLSYTKPGYDEVTKTVTITQNPAPTYTVTFDCDGGTGCPSDISNIVAGSNNFTVPSTVPTKDCYTFAGNYKDASNNTYTAGQQYTITSDLTLTAQWTINQLTINYYSNNGESGEDMDEQANCGSQYTIAGDPGFTQPTATPNFVNWNTQADGNGEKYDVGQVITILGGLDLYAQWSAKASFTVSFDCNGGTGCPSNQTVEDGEEIELPAAPTRDGYTFDGWMCSADMEIYQPDANYTVTSDVEFEAQWLENLTAPTFSVTGVGNGTANTYYVTANITLNQEEDADVYYTTDGTDPSDASTKYTAPFAVTNSCTIKAIAILEGYGNSTISEQAITIVQPNNAAFTDGVYTTLNSEDAYNTWYKYSVTGDQNWEWSSSYAKMTGYVNSTNNANEDWLISPKMHAVNGKLGVAFSCIGRYGDVNESNLMISARYSTNYPGYGNPNSYTWTEVATDPALPYMAGNWNFIDVECDVPGSDVYFAFKYTSTTSRAGTFEVKNFTARQCYPVTYNPVSESGTGTGSYSDTKSPYAVGATVTTAAANVFTAPDGMEFASWNTADDGSGTPYNPGQTFTMPDNAVTLYAQWEESCILKPTMAATTADAAVYNYNGGDKNFTIGIHSSVSVAGGCDITEYGFVYSTNGNDPQIGNEGCTKLLVASANIAAGVAFESSFTSTSLNQSYKIRSYAINNADTAYGAVLTVTTPTAWPTYTITYTTNGAVETTTTSVFQGANISDLLEAPAEANIPIGYTFMGWYGSEYSNASVAPTYVKNGDAIAGNITLKAVFAEQTSAPVAGYWTKVTDLSTVSAGTYALISEAGYAFNGTISSGHGQKTSDAFSFDKDGKAAGAPSGTCELTLTASSSGYTMYNNSTNKYLYAKAASSGNLDWHESESYYWSWSSSNWQYSGNNANLRVYDNTFRTYSNNSNKELYMARKTDAVPAAYANYCTFVSYIVLDDDLTISGDLNVTYYLTVESGQTLTVNGTLINDDPDYLVIEDGGQLILSDDASVQATVKNSTAASTETKTYDIQWNAISSPVDNVVVTSFVKGDTHNVYRYDEKTVYWQEYRGANGFTNLQNGRGYIYRSTESGIEFQGEVITGTVSCADYLSYACDNNRYIGFNLIGNPFTHDITWSNLTTKTNISSAGFFLLGADGNWSAQTTSGTIAPMQAFLVQATEESPVINISNTAGKGDDRYGNDQIQFTVNNSEYSDVAYAIFREGHGLNKIEHRNDNIPMLYIINDDKDYAIAEMPDNTNVINLGFKARAIGQYTLSLNAEGRYSYMHLYDKLTGSDVDMLLDNSYTFVGSPSDRNDRFVLRLNYNAANIDTESDIFAYQNGADIIISGTGELQIFDIMGHQVSTQRINGVETINVSTQGVYILRLVGTEIKTQKIVVR